MQVIWRGVQSRALPLSAVLTAAGPARFKPSEIAPHELIGKTLSAHCLSKVSYSQNNNYVAWETMITAHEPGNGFCCSALWEPIGLLWKGIIYLGPEKKQRSLRAIVLPNPTAVQPASSFLWLSLILDA